MATKSALLDIDAQIEKLRERKKMLIVKSADRFARAATKSGLAELEIADEEVDRIFEEIAARFHKAEKEGVWLRICCAAWTGRWWGWSGDGGFS